ncbi:LytTR family DNA-binding domain-containing protein [Niabella sp.]|uniref:LytR/AlgR family response regulator transcription factor n=1 Tax=Niabella sp. TaxID=1962976 RepID=UPI00262A271C|nr:LytTR family DNA-binding domain-containing protein [Niabella sp.]
MTILIVEDEELAVKKLRSVIAEVIPSAQIAGEADSIAAAVEWLGHHPPPDLILMDIELSDGQSFDIFERTEIRSPVIFTTSYDEYAVQAFKVSSIAYLLKPVEKEDLQEALKKYDELKEFYTTQTNGFSIARFVEMLQSRMQPRDYRQRFLVKYGTRLRSVETKDIAYYFTEERVNYFRTYDNKKFIVDYTLDELEKMIDPHVFFRINRSHLVSVQSVNRIDDYFGQRLALQLNPDGGTSIVSREKVASFKQWLGK